MNLNTDDIKNIKNILACAKLAGVETLVLGEGLARGVNQSSTAVIFSSIDLSIANEVLIGISSVAEFSKRLELFGEGVRVELAGMNTIIKTMTFKEGRQRSVYRCIDPRFVRYPKTRDKWPEINLQLSNLELKQIVSGVKSLGAESVVFAASPSPRWEAVSKSGDIWELEAGNIVDGDDNMSPAVWSAGITTTALTAITGIENPIIRVNDVGQLIVPIGDYEIIIIPTTTQEN